MKEDFKQLDISMQYHIALDPFREFEKFKIFMKSKHDLQSFLLYAKAYFRTKLYSDIRLNAVNSLTIFQAFVANYN